VFFISPSQGWAVGGNWDWNSVVSIWILYVLHTTDSGATWIIQDSIRHSDIAEHIFFISPDEGWIVGNTGIILHTLDGGKNWIPQNSGTSSTLFDVHFTNNLVGCAVGSYGAIVWTTDGGKTWNKPIFHTQNCLESVFFMRPDTALIVGSSGTILKFGMEIPVAIHEKESLPLSHQLYRQLFTCLPLSNEKLYLTYALQEPSMVSITIYDLRGKKLQFLVNVFKCQGTHTHLLPLGSLAQGVYVACIKTNRYEATGKFLILLC
jgi:hypothetical protein